MDFQSLLKYIDDDCTISLEKIFSELNLVQWLLQRFDGTLGKHIAMAHAGLKGHVRRSQATTFLEVLDVVLPQAESHAHNANMTERLVDAVIHPALFILFHNIATDSDHSSLFTSIIMRLVFYCSKRTLSSRDTFLSQRFIETLADYIEPYSGFIHHFFQLTLCLLMERLSARQLRDLFTPKLNEKCRTIADYSNGKYRLLGKIKQLYTKRDIGKMIMDRDACKVCAAFESKDFQKALEPLCSNKDEKPLQDTIPKCIQIFENLERLLASKDHYDVIKSFLQIVLNISQSNSQAVPNASLFNKLIRHLIGTLEGIIPDEEDFKSMSESDDKQLQNHMSTILNLLASLYVLNYSWYQWFDLEPLGPIVEDKTFVSKTLDKLFKDNDFAGKEQWHYDAIVKFPSPLSFKVRMECFKKITNGYVPNKESHYMKVSRDNLLADLFKVFEDHQSIIKQNWFFKFSEEKAEGRGPTKEAYSLISQELQKHEMDMWREESLVKSRNDETTYVHSSVGLFPKISDDAKESQKGFNLFGSLLAKSLYDGHLLDIPLSEEFFQRLTNDKFSHLRRDYYDIPLAFPAAKRFIEDLIWVKRQKDIIRSDSLLSENEKDEKIKKLTFRDGSSFDDLYLNFTAPGSDEELVEGGYDMTLSPLNLENYLDALCLKKSRLEPSREFKAVRDGFEKVFQIDKLQLFSPRELKKLFFGDKAFDWTVPYLEKNCRLADGYSKTSETVQFLFQVMSSFSIEEKTKFLQFVTGSSILPPGGLATLKPPISIKRPRADRSEERLPSVFTCTNLMYLPEYKSLEETRNKLTLAMTEGANVFDFM